MCRASSRVGAFLPAEEDAGQERRSGNDGGITIELGRMPRGAGRRTSGQLGGGGVEGR
jgi:hypothetical protein